MAVQVGKIISSTFATFVCTDIVEKKRFFSSVYRFSRESERRDRSSGLQGVLEHSGGN